MLPVSLAGPPPSGRNLASLQVFRRGETEPLFHVPGVSNFLELSSFPVVAVSLHFVKPSLPCAGSWRFWLPPCSNAD